MGSDLELTTLGEVVKKGDGFIQTGPFGSQLHASDYVAEGVPVIMPVNLANNRISLADIARIEQADADRLSKHLVQSGDIIYSRRGDVTRKALITDDEAGMFCGTGCLLVRPGNAIHARFLTYHLSSPKNQEWIIRHAVGATMPNLNTGILGDIPLSLPSLRVQQNIANILGTLDDKIELNRQMNETLVAMAQALFKSWFVDFDPVIDNALAAGNEIPEPLQKRAAARQALGEQRKPLPAKIQSLFPDSFVFTNEMGWVPEGWKVQSVDESLIINPRLALPKGKTAPFVDMKALPTAGFSVSDVIRKEFNGGSKFQQGDVLFARITPCLENGKTAVVDFLNVEEVGFGSTEFIVLRGKDGISTSFVCCLSRHPKFRSHCEQGMVGSSGRQRVQNSSFNDYYLALPAPENLLQYFDSYTTSYFERISNKRRESETLSELRDALLPKLLSGELRIPDAEKQVAEAV